VVDAGRLGVLLEDRGTVRSVATLGPGDLFGEMSLLTGEERSATVRTLSDARLVEVEAGALREALQMAPDLATHLAEGVTRRREGLVEARAAMSAEAKARLNEGTFRLGELIRQFFRLPPGRHPGNPGA
jgi:CRP-like cAMP-binding protein